MAQLKGEVPGPHHLDLDRSQVKAALGGEQLGGGGRGKNRFDIGK